MKKLVIVGLLLLVTFGCSKSPEEKIFALFKTGTRQVDRYEFDDALATFKQIGEINPSSPMGYYGSGLVLERQSRPYDALHVYLSLTNTSSSFAPAFDGARRMFSQLGLWEDAVVVAAEYARLLPDDPEAHFVFAMTLMNADHCGRARRELDRAVEADAAPALTGLARAQAYCLEHKADSAEAALQAAILGFQDLPPYYAQAAAYFEAAGLIDSAISMGQAAVEAAGGNFDLTITNFHRALKHKYFFEARRIIRQLKEQGAPETVTTGLEMFYYMAKGDEVHAKETCNTYDKISSQSISTYVFDMDVRGREKDLFTGLKNTAAIIKIMETNNYDAEFQDYMKYLLSVLFARDFDDLDGLKVLRSVPAIFSNHKEIRLRIAYCLYRTGQIDEYKELMTLLSEYHSAQPDWLTGLADIYGDRFVREYDKAAQHYRLALKYDKWYRPALENAVMMYRRLKQPKKALELFAIYPHFENCYPEISLLKALCLVENNAIPEGVGLFEQNFPAVRGNLELFDEMTSLLDKKNRPEERAKLYQLLTRIDADNTDALALTAEFESDQASYETALDLAEKALSIEPGYIVASVQKARALYRLGKRSEAFEIFERNLIESHHHADNNYYFSRLLSEEQTDPQRAANLARRAVFDSSHDLRAWMNLSYVYFQIGRYDFSWGEALKASRSHKDEPEPFFRIGIAMYMRGEEKAEVKENLEKAIELGLKGEDLETARATLKKL